MKKIFSFVAILATSLVLLFSCSTKGALEIMASAMNSKCPIDQGNGVVITKVEMTDDLVYTVSIDESVTSLEVFNENYDGVKANIINGLKAQDNAADLVKVLKEVNASIVYNYVGSESGESIEFDITAEDLE